MYGSFSLRLRLFQVSSWKLARELARSGELGIISGTAMDVVVLRWLQDGDPGGLYRKALAEFPDQGMAQRFIDKYYIEGGKAADKPYAPLQMWQLDASQALREACVLGNFCEVGRGCNSPRPRPRSAVLRSNARNEPVRAVA